MKKFRWSPVLEKNKMTYTDATVERPMNINGLLLLSRQPKEKQLDITGVKSELRRLERTGN